VQLETPFDSTKFQRLQQGSGKPKVFTPELTAGTLSSPTWKGKSFFKPPFLDSMLIFQGVAPKFYKHLACFMTKIRQKDGS